MLDDPVGCPSDVQDGHGREDLDPARSFQRAISGLFCYVLRDDALHALVDTFDGGDLIVTQTGFGLIEKKRLRWFREEGSYLGSVVSKDPDFVMQKPYTAANAASGYA